MNFESKIIFFCLFNIILVHPACITRWSDGTSNWPDQACNPTNSFGGCNTNAQDHADAWALWVCANNFYTSGIWTGNKLAGCSSPGTNSMYCSGTIPCTPNFENGCQPGDQTQVEFTCCGNICDTQNCNARGTCEATGVSTYACNCNSGFSGLDCETDPCEGNCTGRGSCSRDADGLGHNCTCEEGFSGNDCEIDPCETEECTLRGVCLRDINGIDYSCSCDEGFSGTDCETDPCAVFNCTSRGDCLRDLNGLGYTCDCDEGYSGDQCDVDPCEGKDCNARGACVRDVNGLGYSCDCDEGATGDDCEFVEDTTPNTSEAITKDTTEQGETSDDTSTSPIITDQGETDNNTTSGESESSDDVTEGTSEDSSESGDNNEGTLIAVSIFIIVSTLI